MLVYQRVHDLNECILINNYSVDVHYLNKYLKSSYINSTCALHVGSFESRVASNPVVDHHDPPRNGRFMRWYGIP
jgi:hypothetical protein